MTQTVSPILSQLNPQQREAAECIHGPVLIFAGAGSGKTRALTYRIAYMVRECGIPPEQILAVTFTNKAANEMKERIRILVGDHARRIWAGTFHSICARILRVDGQAIGIPNNFVIFDEADQQALVREALAVLDIDPKEYSPIQVLARISRAKNELLSVADFARTKKGPMEDVTARVYRIYQEKLRQNNALDFDDLLMRAVDLLASNDEVREKYQERLRYILVDEYQDINYAQYRFVQILAAKHGNICVVGDDDQSIYGWRGANVGIILAFETDYPSCKVVKLEQNYRSTAKIIECAAEIIRRNPERAPKRLWTANHPGDNVVVYEAINETEEAEWVARNIADQIARGVARPRDFAILYRINAMSRNFEEALIAHGIPYRVVGGLRFYERAEIKDIVAYLRVLCNPNDGVSLRRIINTPARAIGEKTIRSLEQFAYGDGRNPIPLYEAVARAHEIEDLQPRAQESLAAFYRMIGQLRAKAERLRLSDLARVVIEETGYAEALQKRGTAEDAGRLENLQEFVTLTAQFEATREPEEATLPAFIEHIALLTAMDEAEERGDSVSLLTLHSAKGLEFPIVFMVGMEEGILPHQRSSGNDQELSEERRLCYVGITRAQRQLYLTYAFRRTVYGDVQERQASPFLGELPQELVTWQKSVRGLARPRIFEEELDETSQPVRGALDLTRILARRREPAHSHASFSSIAGEKRPSIGPGAKTELSTDGDWEFAPGTKVRHAKFGDGIVLSREGVGEEAVVTVAFITTGVKKLALQYANLEKR